MELNLNEIESLIKGCGFETYIEAPTEEIPFDQLYVGLGHDEEKRDRCLQIRLYSQTFPETPFSQEPISPKYLDFFTSLPFFINEKAFPDVARLTSLINKILSLPGFVLSESDKQVYYRYLYLNSTEKMASKDIELILMTILYQIETFSPSFEELALGDKTYEEVVKAAAAYCQED